MRRKKKRRSGSEVASSIVTAIHNSQRLAASLVLLLLLAAACSSTEHSVSRSRRISSGASGASPPTSTTSNGRWVGAAESGARATSANEATAAVPAPAGTKGIIGSGRVRIGYSVTQGADRAAAQLGIGGVSTAGGQSEAEAVIKYVNAHGGLAGRTIVPVFQSFDSQSSSYSAEAQAACSKWAEDEPVFAAIVAAGDLDKEVLASCLARKNIPLIKSAAVLYDKTFADRYRGYFYQPTSLWGDRWGVVVDVLMKRKWIGEADKLGLIRFDTPEHKRTSDDVIKPRFKGHGIRVVREEVVNAPESTSQISQAEAEASNVVLRFNQAGITHVFFVERGPTFPLLFMTSAESQEYRPGYGLASITASLLNENVPERQLRNISGVGWAPAADVEFNHTPVGGASYALCMKILKDSGHTYTDGLALQSALFYCDHTLFLKIGLERAREFSPAGLLASVDDMGTSFGPANAFAARFAPGHYDGVSLVRPYGFDEKCGCLVYVGGPVRAP